MKFIAKSTNLNVILRPGIPAQPITGTPAVPTLFARFVDGIFGTEDEKMIEMLLRHPACGTDFIVADALPSDPYAHQRTASEPDHVITEMVGGVPVRRIAPKAPIQLTPEIKKFLADQALEMAKPMAMQLAKAMLEQMAQESAAANKPAEDKVVETESAPGKIVPKVKKQK